jgi:hypothetical protein
MAEEFTRQGEMQPARLGNMTGLGIVTLERDASGVMVEANGSWRLEDAADDQAQRIPFQVGETTTYDGLVADNDPDRGDTQARALEVVITSIRDYTYDDGKTRTIVNFVGKTSGEATRS